MIAFRPLPVLRVLAALVCLGGSVVPGLAQTVRPGSLRVTVRDATNLAIADAAVTVMAAGGGESEGRTGPDGRVSVEGLAPGAYSAVVGAPGFEPVTLTGLVIRSGARLDRSVRLEIAGLVEQVDVAPAVEERDILDAFTTTMTADEIDALPEDPEELALVLRQMVGDDAEILVDGFGGGLPPGAQIQDVRIRWDGGAAGSGGGGPRVEIRTRPGGDRWRSSANASVRDERLNARNAFASERPSGQTRQYSWSINGPVVRNRTGLSLSIDGTEAREQQVVRAALPGGVLSSLVDQPTSRLRLSARLDHALTDAQTLRVEVRQGRSGATNQGIGELDLPERAYTREGSDGRVRASHRTARGSTVNDLRFGMDWSRNESVPASTEPAIRVLDAYSTGGAQVQGGRRSRTLEIENETEFTLGQRHQVTIGAELSGGRYRGDEWRNAAGTFTFPSLEAFEAGRPSTFVQRQGDPAFGYSMYEFAWYVQDNYRLRRNLIVNLGLRHDLQTHFADRVNFSPRAGVNWTPIPGRRTTVRASFNVFHQTFGASLYEDTLLVDGDQQRDMVIANPSYPDPFGAGEVRASRAPSIIRAGLGLVMPVTREVLIGVNEPLAPWARLRATYTRRAGHNLFRSRDANAPIGGARPDPSVRNITEIESTARSLSHSLDMALSLTYEPRRLSGNVSYRWRRVRDETDGTLTLPPDSYDLSGEWGPSRQDLPHRLDLSMNGDLAAGFRANASFRVESGSPYTITTGLDSNGDGTSNERPAGVGRNSARGAATKNLDLTLTWGYGAESSRRGGQGRERAGGGTGGTLRVEIYARATNVLNLVNAQRFSGVMTSPFFGQPTSAGAARRVVLGTRVSF